MGISVAELLPGEPCVRTEKRPGQTRPPDDAHWVPFRLTFTLGKGITSRSLHLNRRLDKLNKVRLGKPNLLEG